MVAWQPPTYQAERRIGSNIRLGSPDGVQMWSQISGPGMTALDGLTKRQAIVNSRFAYLGAVVAMSGIQLIAPSLPGMRDALGISDAQLALVTSLYLLPAAVSALPAGILADRIGRRKVFGWSFIVLGVSGAALQFATGSFGIFLAIRFIQGTAFGGLMPLTMTILGDAWRGSDLVRAHGRRTFFMHTGDGSLPIIGGVLVSLAWWAPWLGQLLAIPLGIVVLRKLRDPDSIFALDRIRIRPRDFVALFRTAPVIALQYVGFLRMFLKFSIITFMPLLLIDSKEFSPAFAGLVIGASSLTGTIPAFFAGRIARFGRATTFVFVGLAVEGLALAFITLTTSQSLIILAAFVFGLADGLGAVFVNSFVSAATGPEQRASFVAATGAVRNAAKFMAPATLGALILLAPLTTTFVVLASVTAMSSLAAIPMRGLDARLSDTNAQ